MCHYQECQQSFWVIINNIRMTVRTVFVFQLAPCPAVIFCLLQSCTQINLAYFRVFIAHRLVTSTPCFLHVLVPETFTCFFLFCFLFSIPVAKRSSALRVCRVPRDQLSIKPHGQYRDFSVDGGSVLVSVLLCLFQTKNIAGAEHTSLPVNYLRKNPCDSNCKLQMCL